MQDCDYRIENGVLTIAEGVTVIERLAFKDRKDFKKLIMSDSVEEVKGAAFLNCKSLEEIVFSKNLTVIGYNGFGSTALKALHFPDSLEIIENYAFYGCPDLSEAYFGKGIKRIGNQSFSCSGLKTAVFPENSMTVPAEAFGGCFDLRYLECERLTLLSPSASFTCGAVLSYLHGCCKKNRAFSDEIAREVRENGKRMLTEAFSRSDYDLGAFMLKQGLISDEDISQVLSKSNSLQANAIIVDYLNSKEKNDSKDKDFMNL